MVFFKNYSLRKTARNFNAPMGKAAKFTIAEVIIQLKVLQGYFFGVRFSVQKFKLHCLDYTIQVYPTAYELVKLEYL